MPSNVTNLDELVGGDHTFIYRDKEYRIPGDPATSTVFEFLKLYDDLQAAQEKAAKAGETAGLAGERADIEKLILAIREKLLILFKELQPDMVDLPFGHTGTMLVLRAVLGLLGVTMQETEPDPQVPTPTPKRATSVKKTPAKKRAATRSGR